MHITIKTSAAKKIKTLMAIKDDLNDNYFFVLSPTFAINTKSGIFLVHSSRYLYQAELIELRNF